MTCSGWLVLKLIVTSRNQHCPSHHILRHNDEFFFALLRLRKLELWSVSNCASNLCVLPHESFHDDTFSVINIEIKNFSRFFIFVWPLVRLPDVIFAARAFSYFKCWLRLIFVPIIFEKNDGMFVLGGFFL